MTDRPDRWHISQLVLLHQQRFFEAATMLVHQWPDEQHDQFTTMIALLGNMLWARSTYDAANRDQEQLMAYAGATAGTLADQIAPNSHHKEALLAYLDQLEQQMLEAHDPLVAHLTEKIASLPTQDCSPASVNALVWSALFADIPYPSGLYQIQESLAKRLRKALS